jgi:hypothetical protein
MKIKASITALTLSLASLGFAENPAQTAAPEAAPAPQPTLVAAMHQLKTWVETFRNKDEAFVINAIKDLKDLKVTRSTYDANGDDELLIVASGPDSTLSFYFFRKRVIRATVNLAFD